MPQQFLICPASATTCFGNVPEMKSKKIILPSGEIRLLTGAHRAANKGFGAAHIWAEHESEIRAAGFTDESDVAAFVAEIVKAGTALHFPGLLSPKRLMACHGIRGTAIIEFRESGDDEFWSIVTAFAGNKKHGPRTGTVF